MVHKDLFRRLSRLFQPTSSTKEWCDRYQQPTRKPRFTTRRREAQQAVDEHHPFAEKFFLDNEPVTVIKPKASMPAFYYFQDECVLQSSMTPVSMEFHDEKVEVVMMAEDDRLLGQSYLSDRQLPQSSSYLSAATAETVKMSEDDISRSAFKSQSSLLAEMVKHVLSDAIDIADEELEATVR